jgi:SAM-dependent methyltransferase
LQASRRPLRLSFGNVATTYHRVRPPYSQECLDRAQEALSLGDEACVLDLAAGTGRLTHELVLRFARVIAVEPDEAMRALIADGDVAPGSAEAIPVADSSVDAVFVGEAFHWFDAPVAIDEIARVLRPHGGLAVIWVHWWETEPPLPEPAQELLRGPWLRSQAEREPPWDDAFLESPFEPLRYEEFQDEVVVGPDELLELYSTTSALAALPDDERLTLFAEVRALLAGPYRLPIKHELTWTRLAV